MDKNKIPMLAGREHSTAPENPKRRSTAVGKLSRNMFISWHLSTDEAPAQEEPSLIKPHSILSKHIALGAW